jgi:ribokinase
VQVAALAHSLGVPVVMDAGGEDAAMAPALCGLLTFLCPNETELARLVGMPTATQAEVLAAARALQTKGVRNVLVTLGEDGALLLTEGGEVLLQKSHRVRTVLDTTGAGDCFRGAFTTALTEGKALQDCLAAGAAASAVCVTRMGAIPR